MKYTLKIMSVVLFFASTSYAQSSVEDNPYVFLYSKRLEAARSQAKNQISVAKNEKSLWSRMANLGNQGAVSRLEVEEQESKYKVAQKMLEVLNAKTQRAQALYNIAKLRVEAGLDMSLCTVDK